MPDIKKLNVRGIDIEATVKAVKHLRLSVSGGRVKMTVPRGVPLKTAENFAYEKYDWIVKQLSRPQQRAAGPFLEEGGSLRVWGVNYPVAAKQGKRYGIKLSGGIAEFTVKEGGTDARKKYITEFYRRLLTAAAENRLPPLERLTGLRCASLSVRDMKTRWGTCNTRTGKICLAVRLAERPPECLDYVIVHELAHLLVPNHGKEFKALMDKFYPDWRRIKKLL